MEPRKLVLYIATSLDGYIAKNDDDLGWLSAVETPGEDYGYSAFIKTVDTVILGRRTYDKVLSFGIDFPHKDRKCYVVTKTPRAPIGSIEFYTGDLSALISKIRSEEGKHIFLDGGAQLVNEFMRLDLIDEFIISIIPVYLGSGIRLFQEGRPEYKVVLQGAQSYPSGLVQLHYVRDRQATVEQH